MMHRFRQLLFLPNCINHVKTHLDTIASMVVARFWKTGNTVIAIAKDLDPQAFVVLKIETLLGNMSKCWQGKF